MNRLRLIIFLKDILILSLTTIGGPHSHLPLILDRLVKKRGYITEEELLELNALCQILPGPASTQTITAVGYKIGGAKLAYLTLLVWVFPSMVTMMTAAIFLNYFARKSIDLSFTKFLEPMAVGFVTFAAWVIINKVIKTKFSILLLVISTILGFFFRSPYITPIMLLAGGLSTVFRAKDLKNEHNKSKLEIKWANFFLFGAVFLITFLIGVITKSIPIKLFESFYRNGSLIFGGGQVLIPLLHTEYVDLKKYLSSEEFLMGYALVSAIPGPIFSISAFIGTLSMREYGIGGEILGGILSTAGIFLPGTFLIFFAYRLWIYIKQNKYIKAALEGINAVSAGLVLGVSLYLANSIELNFINAMVVIGTLVLLISEKIPTILILAFGLGLGYIF